MTFRVALGLILTLVLSLSGQALFRRGVTEAAGSLEVTADELFRRHLLRVLLSPFVIAGALLNLVAVVCWLYVLAHFELSRALPMLGGMGYVVLFVVGRVWLGEETTWLHLLGIALVGVGMVLITLR